MATSRLALAALLALAAPAHAAAPPDVGCARCIVVDEDGNVLWARNARDRYPNASTTKMVTALLVSQAADPAETVV
ncbi:MAG: D-alanyl-D-alanine carboxypeptidase, partial [Actinobacteria bacterium]|nr:D-alanyl-D-alanine carboxypeptidase [Actinomycetota bacterium]